MSYSGGFKPVESRPLDPMTYPSPPRLGYVAFAVLYCSTCRHARQIHVPADDSPCRGGCRRHRHTADTHTGACSANRCECGRYRERQAA